MHTRHHLMIVDDDPEERYLMQLAFTDISWDKEVLFFHCAEAILQHLAQLAPAQYPALLLFDYRMPDIDGGMLLDIFKKEEQLRHMPVLIYSTHLTSTLKEHLQQKGAVQCFYKAHNYSRAIAFANLLRQICLTGILPQQPILAANTEAAAM